MKADEQFAHAIQIYLLSNWMMNLAQEEEILKSHRILLVESELEDFTLKALIDFTQCASKHKTKFGEEISKAMNAQQLEL